MIRLRRRHPSKIARQPIPNNGSPAGQRRQAIRGWPRASDAFTEPHNAQLANTALRSWRNCTGKPRRSGAALRYQEPLGQDSTSLVVRWPTGLNKGQSTTVPLRPFAVHRPARAAAKAGAPSAAVAGRQAAIWARLMLQGIQERAAAPIHGCGRF